MVTKKVTSERPRRLFGTVTPARALMLLLPVVSIALLFVPALNLGRFISLTADWTWVHTLQNSMQIDQLFTAAYPGIRDMFAFNSMLIFSAFAIAAAVGLQVLGMAVSLIPGKLGKAHFRSIGSGIELAGGIGAVLVGVLSIFQALGAKANVARQNYAMEYVVPLGAIVFLAEGVLIVVCFFIARRQWLKERQLYLRMTKTEIRENLKGWAFIMPYVLGFFVFTAYPLLFSASTSFTYYNITAVQKWYGVRNFTNLFNDDLFYKSLGNTLYYVAFSVPLVIILALMLALLMNTKPKGVGVFRTLYYLPSVLSGVAVYMLWQWIFDPGNGLLNNGLALIGVKGPAWMYDMNYTKPALIIMRLWHTGSTMILLLAALQNVPEELYEAGELDGATGIKKLWHITLPMISPTLFFVMVTGISGAFQVYDSAYIMTSGDGGPGKSLLFYNLYLFNTAFADQAMGKASAMAWILFAIIMFFTAIQQIASKKWVYYAGGTD